MRPTYSLAPKGSRAAGPRGQPEPPSPEEGPRDRDNPASSSPAMGLRLVGPAGPLPHPSLGAAPCVGSLAGEGVEPLLPSRWVHGSIFASLAGRCGRSSIRSSIPAPLSSAAAVSTSCFLSALAPPRAAWSKRQGSPGGRRVLPLPLPSSLPTPIVPEKVWAVKVNLRVPENSAPCACPSRPGFHSLSGRFPTPACGSRCVFWGPRHPSPSCLLPLLHPVWQCPCFCQLLCLCLTVPPGCPGGPASPGFLGVGRVVSVLSTWTHTQHTLTHAPLARAWLLVPKAWGTEPH